MRSEQGQHSACMLKPEALSVNPKTCDWHPKGWHTDMKLQILGNENMEGHAVRDSAFHHYPPFMSLSNDPNDGQP
jgi:hypothetical protein